jgi:formiminotetrahydrofolate cyclodeaminase
MLMSTTVIDALDAFSDASPTPGGGSAAALAGALGASLLMMVGRLPKTRGGDQDREPLAAAVERLRELRGRLSELVDLDSAAYDAVVAAYKLPNASEEERAARRDAIARALRHATDTPRETMECCRNVMEQALVVAERGSRNAASDVGVAIELLGAALRGARLNVETNLRSLTDQEYAEAIRARVADVIAHAGSLTDRANLLLS